MSAVLLAGYLTKEVFEDYHKNSACLFNDTTVKKCSPSLVSQAMQNPDISPMCDPRPNHISNIAKARRIAWDEYQIRYMTMIWSG